jgi:hypothetical protein
MMQSALVWPTIWSPNKEHMAINIQILEGSLFG